MSSGKIIVWMIRAIVWAAFFGGFMALVYIGLSATVESAYLSKWVACVLSSAGLLVGAMVYIAIGFELRTWVARIRYEEEP